MFRQRRFSQGCEVLLDAPNQAALQSELARRIRRHEATRDVTLTRKEKQEVAITIGGIWGRLKTTWWRREFWPSPMPLAWVKSLHQKTLRHTFATNLQDSNVDPLIRNELMGHVPAGISQPGGGLAMTAVPTLIHGRKPNGGN